LILLGVFKSKLVISLIAFTGVVGAAYYALRMFITSMHNRVGPDVVSRELEWREAAGIVPLVGVILVLAFYPHFILRRTEPSVRTSIATAQAMAGQPSAVTASLPAKPAGGPVKVASAP
jgi:NADH-quinone oxidoreductase subunit M